MYRSRGASVFRRAAAFGLAASLIATLAGCSSGTGTKSADDAKAPVKKTQLIVASTTSTQDSGLFEVLIPAFSKAFPDYDVKIVAVGTGEAIELGRNKDADVLLVHAKADEEQFVKDGYGPERRDVMYNDFLMVGPAADPAGVKSAADVNAAMAAIEKAGKAGKTVFVTRGDDSGTHKKELKLWKAASISPTETAGKWYVSTGQGMGDTLKIASEKQGYTLVDRATYLSMKDALDLEILIEKQKDLLNQYGVLPVAGAKNAQGATDFMDWITGAEGQKVISEFGVEKFGQQLFVPNATQ